MSGLNYRVPTGWKIRRMVIAIMKKLNFAITHKKQMEVLKARGLKIGKNVIIDQNAIIDGNFAFLVSVGDNSTISAGVRILAHDNSIFLHTGGHGRLGKVDIKENCIIGSDSVILPGVTIGPNVIVAAGSVVNRDIPPNSCVAGVPARFYSKYDDVIKKYKESIENGYIIDSRKVLLAKASEETKSLIRKKLDEGQDVFMSDITDFAAARNRFE